jgi:hypothetical protein
MLPHAWLDLTMSLASPPPKLGRSDKSAEVAFGFVARKLSGV